MHDDPNNDVKFRIRKQISKKRDNFNRRISVTEEVAVADPLKSPEASNGRCVLRHMRSAYREYADTLDYHSSGTFKNLLSTIIAWIPKRRNASFRWKELFNTLLHMRWLIESVIEGLERTGRFSLADGISCGLNELRNITEGAKLAQKQSPQ